MTVQTDLITVREAARRCQRTPETVRRWIWDGRLPAQELGNQLFIHQAVLDRLAGRDPEVIKAKRLAALEELAPLRDELARRGVVLNSAREIERARESRP